MLNPKRPHPIPEDSGSSKVSLESLHAAADSKFSCARARPSTQFLLQIWRDAVP